MKIKLSKKIWAGLITALIIAAGVASPAAPVLSNAVADLICSNVVDCNND